MNENSRFNKFMNVVKKVAIGTAIGVGGSIVLTFLPAVLGLGTAAAMGISGVVSAVTSVSLAGFAVAGGTFLGVKLVQGIGRLINFFRTPKAVRQERRQQRKQQRKQERDRRRGRGPRDPNGPAPVLKAAKKLKMSDKKAKKAIIKQTKKLIKEGKLDEARNGLDAIKEVLANINDAANLIKDKKERKNFIKKMEKMLVGGQFEEINSALKDLGYQCQKEEKQEEQENNKDKQEEQQNSQNQNKEPAPSFTVNKLSEENQKIYNNIIRNKTFENVLRNMDFVDLTGLKEVYARQVKEIKKKPAEEMTEKDVQTIATYKKIIKIYKEKKSQIDIEQANSKIEESLKNSNNSNKR